MGMERIMPLALEGANAYFTGFDNRIVNRTENREALKLEVSRTLKILLLTKNNVVCAASHLTNELTYELLYANPILLDRQMIIPAFREDKQEVSELFERKKISQDRLNNSISFYGEHLSKTVLWKLEENATRFRDTFVNGLSKGTVIYSNLKRYLSETKIKKLAQDIQQREVLDRGFIEQISSRFHPECRTLLRNFREYMYHRSGAKAVNCETTLPQENYLDYSFTNLKSREVELSELQVFWKLYIDLISAAFGAHCFPPEMLDLLSFEDIYELRQPIMTTKFTQKYNDLLARSAEVVTSRDRPDLLFDAQELLTIQRALEEHFQETHHTINAYFQEKLQQKKISFGTRTAIFFASFIPLGSTITNYIGAGALMAEARALWSNQQRFTNGHPQSFSQVYQDRNLVLQRLINKFPQNDKTVLLNVLALIHETIDSKFKILP